MIAEAWCLAKLDVTTAERAILEIAAKLVKHGRVRASFGHATVARERRSPTGVPFASLAVAIPHVEPEHVLASSIAVATLASPLAFREMGSPQSVLDVRIVIVPAFEASDQASGALSRLIELLQDDGLRAALVDAQDERGLVRLLLERWEG
ncbi:PTS sugar transporter subunit IIA [Pendulispora albinea]|uniref:PTS sugar transporter subunit IIA n=1 Tax=Pendulispora albinea TaxID=2741071 RepID=A0ABZ2LKW0_9BACT